MKKILILALIFNSLFSILNLSFAQSSGSNSPYSRYGWGLLADEAMGFNKGMGGVALGMRDINIINPQNPAAYSEMDSLTFLFDAGISLQNCRMQAGSTKKNVQNSTLDYIAAAFRLRKGLGFSLGLRPFSTIGYSFSATSDMDDIDGYGTKVASSSYVGSGGLHELYGGVGWRVFKPLSVGMNMKYVWGDYSHSSSVSYSESSIRSLNRNYKANLNALCFDFGLQYSQRLSKKDRVTLGLAYGLGNKIDQRATLINTQSSSTGSAADTVRVGNAFELPRTMGVGLSWNHDLRWTVAADYTLQQWKDCRFPELQSGNGGNYTVTRNSFLNRQRIAAGVEFIPNPRGLKIRDHIAYRAGVAYTTPYIKVNGADGPKSYLVSLGASLPIANKYADKTSAPTVINVSAQWEHCKPSMGGAIKEDYLRLCVGITFNARWFEQWKVR